MNYCGIFSQWKQSGIAVGIQKNMVPLTLGLEVEAKSQDNEGLGSHARCLDFNL